MSDIDTSQFIKPGEIQGYGQKGDPLQIRTYRDGGREEVVGVTRLSTQQLHDILERGHDDALMEIEKAKRILSGALDVKTMRFAERIKGNGTGFTEYHMDLVKAFNDWNIFMQRNSPQARDIVIQIVDGKKIDEILAKEQFMSRGTLKRLVDMALETWRELRGQTKKERPRIPPTNRQSDALEYIHDYYSKNEKAPTYKEIMKALGLSSVSMAQGLVDGLVQRGYISKVPGVARGIEII